MLLVGLGGGLLLVEAAIGWAVDLGIRASGAVDHLPAGARRTVAPAPVRRRREPEGLEPLDPVDPVD